MVTLNGSIQLLQLLPLDKPHNQVLALSWKAEMIDHLGLVGVAQVGQQGSLAGELADGFGGCFQVLFQCTGGVEIHIPGVIDAAKTALP